MFEAISTVPLSGALKCSNLHLRFTTDAVIILQQQEINPKQYIPARTNYSLEHNL